MKKPADLFLNTDHKSDQDYVLNDDKTITSSPTSIGIKAPIGAVRPFTSLLSPTPIAKYNFKTCPDFFETSNRPASSLDLTLDDEASGSEPTTSPGRHAPLLRRHETKRRHSI